MRERHFADLHKICDRLISFFGPGKLVESIGPSEFQNLQFSYPASWGLRRQKREIGGTRSIFTYAVTMEKIGKARFGEYKQPDKEQLNAERKTNERKHGNREFTPEQIRTILDAATIPMKAMVLLGINCPGGTRQIFCTFAAPPRISARNTGSMPLLYVCGRCCLCPDSA